jgi:hypothetical protein
MNKGYPKNAKRLLALRDFNTYQYLIRTKAYELQNIRKVRTQG